MDHCMSATLTISDWLGELQTTPCKTFVKGFVKPPSYLLALALALAPRTNGERLTYGNTKKNMGAVEMMRCRRSGDLLGSQSPTPGTSGGSICREVVCSLPVNPKQKKKK